LHRFSFGILYFIKMRAFGIPNYWLQFTPSRLRFRGRLLEQTLESTEHVSVSFASKGVHIFEGP
jgi:hypothetical protein